MRHLINASIAVITFETANPLSSEATERFSYFAEYRDNANDLRESEIQNGFFSAEHCIEDAKQNLDALDMQPEVKAFAVAPIITPYHLHLCNAGCANYRCVNPACMSREEFPRQIAEIICPGCGEQTGTRNYFKAQRFAVVELTPLDAVAIAA